VTKKTKLVKLQDRRGDLLTFIVTVYYDNGVVESYDFWPFDPDMKESIEDYIENDF
jgi:hypothetical protein